MYNCLFINEVNSLRMLASYEEVEIKWRGDKITLWNFGNLAAKMEEDSWIKWRGTKLFFALSVI